MNSTKISSNKNPNALSQTAITYLKRKVSGSVENINKAWNNLNLGSTQAENLKQDQLRSLQNEIDAIVTKSAEYTLDEYNKDIKAGFKY